MTLFHSIMIVASYRNYLYRKIGGREKMDPCIKELYHGYLNNSLDRRGFLKKLVKLAGGTPADIDKARSEMRRLDPVTTV